MNALEKQLLKDLLHLIADKELKALIDAIDAKLPPSAKVVVDGLEPVILPQLLAFVDAKIDAI